MSDNQPSVSVIIPVYNSERYIEETLSSVFDQTISCYEIIVIDDGSTDDTFHIIQNYKKKIRYVRQDHKGVSAARNRGLSLARGDYVAFLDADDLCKLGKLQKQIDILEKNSQIDYVHSGWCRIDENNKEIKQVKPWLYAPILDLISWLKYQPVFLGAILFRKSCFKELDSFNEQLLQAEDTDFLLRLAQNGANGTWLKELTVCYRFHEESLTRNTLQKVMSVNEVINAFFEQRELLLSVKQLQREIKFQILMWSVWQLFSSGSFEGISTYLCKLQNFSNDNPMQTTRIWLGNLLQYCKKDDYPYERLKSLWPYFKDAMGVDDADWQRIQKPLDWLLETEIKLKTKQRIKT